MTSKLSAKEMEELLGRYIRHNQELLKEISTQKEKISLEEYWSRYFCRELIAEVQHNEYLDTLRSTLQSRLDKSDKNYYEQWQELTEAQHSVEQCESKVADLELTVEKLQRRLREMETQQAAPTHDAESIIKEMWNTFVKQYHPDTVQGDSYSKVVRQEVFKDLQHIFDSARNKLKQKKSK